MAATAPSLMLYRDAIEHLYLYSGGAPQEQHEDRVRVAVQNAYKAVQQAGTWRYFITHGRINVSAYYTTGIAQYATVTNRSTLAGGIWPTWAKDGKIRFSDTGDVSYKVAKRINSTTIELDSVFHPPEQITDQTFEIYRCKYPLPADMREIWDIEDSPDQSWQTFYVQPSEWLYLERQMSRTGRPWYWTIMGDEDYYGGMALYLHGRPTTAQTFDFIYQRKARDLQYDGYASYSSQGTYRVGTTGDSTSASFNSLAPAAGAVGAAIRSAHSGASNPPGGLGSANAYNEQRIIQSISGQAVTVGSNWDNSASVVHFVISDPVDLPAFLHPAFLRRCEYELAIIMNRQKDVDRAYGLYKRELLDAMGVNGAQAPSPKVMDGWGYWQPSFMGSSLYMLEGTLDTGM